MPATLTAKSVLAELEQLGSASYRATMKKHDVREPIHGVKISDLKQIQKRAGGTNHELALELWDTGVYDAMYLAALMADDARMGPRDLQRWIGKVKSSALAEYSVAWVTAGSPSGWETALKWIDSRKELEAVAGWNALAGIVTLRPDDELDLAVLRRLLARVEREIHEAPDRVRYVMNNFVIAVGGSVKPLTAEALALGKRVGKVKVDMGETACKVPGITEYIGRIKARGALGKKRKTVKC
jgi:hypothetical protein